MPVETPSRASTETVNAVDWVGPLRATISGICSSSRRSPSIGMQIRPRPWAAMKLIASGVANWAAMARSPSFSRSSSSTIRTIRPIRKSSIASGTVQKDAWTPDPCDSDPFLVALTSSLQEALDVFCDHVDFNIHRRAQPLRRQCNHGLGVGDERDPEPIAAALGHGQAHPIETNVPLHHDIAHQLVGSGEPDTQRVAVDAGLDDAADAVDVALNVVAAEPRTNLDRPLQVDPIADR